MSRSRSIALRAARVAAAAFALAVGCIHLTECSSASSSADGPGASDAATDAVVPGADGEACSSELSTDPNNCGRCAHVCLGGACVAGVCQPFPLTVNQNGPSLVGVDKDFVYFVSDQAYRVPKTGGAPAPIGPSGSSRLGSKYLYTIGNDIRGYDKTGIDAPDANLSKLILQNPDFTNYFTLFGELANGQLLVSFGPISAVPAVIAEVPLEGEPDAGFPWAQAFPLAIESDQVFGANVFAMRDTHLTYTWAPTIWEIDVSAPDAGSRSLTSNANPSAIARDAARVYWADINLGSIRALDVPASGPVVDAPVDLAVGQNGPNAIAVDTTSVYWSTDPGGTVVACPLSGCGVSPRVLASLQARPVTVFVDDVAVYWAQNAGGAVMAVAK